MDGDATGDGDISVSLDRGDTLKVGACLTLVKKVHNIDSCGTGAGSRPLGLVMFGPDAPGSAEGPYRHCRRVGSGETAPLGKSELAALADERVRRSRPATESAAPQPTGMTRFELGAPAQQLVALPLGKCNIEVQVHVSG
ncbi:hypothetical protein GCM10027072_73590 [Streptomyces bullii]